MTDAQRRDWNDETVTIGSVDLHVQHTGEGPPLLLLHGEDGTLFLGPLVHALAQHFEITVPDHPGWGGTDRPPSITSIRDIADVYVEYLESMPIPVAVLGLSLGGWIAAEMAATVTKKISALLLVAPIGIKVGDRETRDFVDLYVIERAERANALYADTTRAPTLATLDESALLVLARAEEEVTRHCWAPYMHDPTLIHRLRRVGVPSLVIAGADDRFALAPGYYEEYSHLLGCQSGPEVVLGAGHRVEEEQPDVLASTVVDFVTRTADGSHTGMVPSV